MKAIIYEPYHALPSRYDGSDIHARRCGNSGLWMPSLSLGFWWNFGADDALSLSRRKMLHAFDNGIFCFDLANNYGPPYGSAEETFGNVYERDLKPYRGELIVTTKAGYDMWSGPNGVGSSRRMLITSLEQSLRRLKLEYVDIFYSHRYDENTPLEETVLALKHIVDSGKAIYIGLSNYPANELRKALGMLEELKVPVVIYQGRYNMLTRGDEAHIQSICREYGVGYTAYSPLAKGLLSDRYLKEVPSDSRLALGKHLFENDLTPEIREKLNRLNNIALERGQSLAQMSVAWLLNNSDVTSVIIGPRTMEQLETMIGSLDNIQFSEEELSQINHLTI